MEEKVLFDGDNKQKRFYLIDTMRTFNNKGESIFVVTSEWKTFASFISCILGGF